MRQTVVTSAQAVYTNICVRPLKHEVRLIGNMLRKRFRQTLPGSGFPSLAGRASKQFHTLPGKRWSFVLVSCKQVELTILSSEWVTSKESGGFPPAAGTNLSLEKLQQIIGLPIREESSLISYFLRVLLHESILCRYRQKILSGTEGRSPLPIK